MAAETIRVHGLRELLRDMGRLDKDVKRGLNRRLRAAGDLVAQAARPRLARYDQRSAMGIRPRVRGASVLVEQRRSKVTGRRGDFGVLQMRRAFLPALVEKGPDVEDAVERMFDEAASSNGFRGGR